MAKSKTADQDRPPEGDMMRRAAEEAHQRILDNPIAPDKPDEIRHLLYFLAVIGGGFALNLVVLAVIAG